jgi:hypothetical protein
VGDETQEAVRRGVREAAERLRRDAGTLSTAGSAIREVGLRARSEDLRAAALAAWDSGVSAAVIAADAGLETAVVERWIALHTFRDGLR